MGNIWPIAASLPFLGCIIYPRTFYFWFQFSGSSKEKEEMKDLNEMPYSKKKKEQIKLCEAKNRLSLERTKKDQGVRVKYKLNVKS